MKTQPKNSIVRLGAVIAKLSGCGLFIIYLCGVACDSPDLTPPTPVCPNALATPRICPHRSACLAAVGPIKLGVVAEGSLHNSCHQTENSNAS